MKKFYTLFSAALVAASALAAPAQHPLLHQTLVKGKKAPAGAVEKFDYSPERHTSALHKAPRLKAPSPSDIIPGRPAGKATLYERSSVGYLVFYGSILMMADTGSVAEIINRDDGKTYINVPISGTYMDAWVECTLTDTELVIPGNQPIHYEEDYGYMLTLTVMEFTETEEGMAYYPAEDQEFRMQIEDGVITSIDFDQDGEKVLGVCYYMIDEDTYDWSGFGDWAYEFKLFEDEPVEGPRNNDATEQWALLGDDDGYFVNINVSDDTLYIQGLYPNLPDAWVKTPLTDGKGMIDSPVYIGQELGHYIYLQPAEIETVWDDYYEQYFEEAYPSEYPYVMEYDAEAKKISTTGALAATYGLPSIDDWYAYGYIADATICKQTRTPGTAPVAPFGLTDVPDEDYPLFTFVLPPFDVEGNLLDTSRLYYNVYVDDELFVFYPDEYRMLDEEMTDVPYNFSDDYDILAEGPVHDVYYYWNGVESIGVRAFYVEDDGTKVYGDMTTILVGNDSVASVASESSAVYYDLNGLRVANPEKGIFIRRSVMSDGSVKVTKVVR